MRTIAILAMMTLGLGKTYACDDFKTSGMTKEEVRTFLAEIKSAISNKDKEHLSKLVSYPLDVYLDGVFQTVEDHKEFELHYESIVTDRVINDVSSAEMASLFANYRGVMIGNGTIWFSSVLDEYSNKWNIKITAINNRPIK